MALPRPRAAGCGEELASTAGVKTRPALVTECRAETVAGGRGGRRALQAGAVFCSVLCPVGD